MNFSLFISVSETIIDNTIELYLKFLRRKVQVERVNIKGNNVTNDSVMKRLLDEGDPYSDIKIQKSISNLRSRIFLKLLNIRFHQDLLAI